MNFSKLKFFNFRLGHKIGRKSADFQLISGQKNFKIILLQKVP